MSCYEWERGTLVLPAAAVAPLRKALREHQNALHDEVRAGAVLAHREVGQGAHNWATYRSRLYAWAYPQQEPHTGGRLRWRSVTQMEREERQELVRRIVYTLLCDTVHTGVPHSPTVADVNQVVKKVTNRDDVFTAVGNEGYPDATISFAGRKVTWSVPNNNHQIERAHATGLAQVFFAELAKITWTRGTGGQIMSNNEYNERRDDGSQGSDYVTYRFGPIGDEGHLAEMVHAGVPKAAAQRALRAAKTSTSRPAARRF